MAGTLAVPALQVRFKDPSVPGASWNGWGFPRYGLLTNPVTLVPAPPLLVGWELNLRPVVTAWLMSLTNALESRRSFNCEFWSCRLLICAYCLLILFWHCLELFFDSLFSESLIWLTSVLLPFVVTEDLLCHACPPNIVTRHPWNLLNVSSSGEDCSVLWAMTA